MNIAMYLRVSDSDHDLSDKKNESDSIESQRILVLNYISNNPELIGEVTEYSDDGYTGTNFNRPGFQAMISDAKKGKINVIVVKDLSRLGREYIEMGDYLEQIFPLLGVRVIAINSRYDSRDHEGDVAGIDSAITNLINSMYSRDLSVKRKSTNRTRWANGTVKATVVPYGYDKDSETKEWLIDEYSGNVVRRIFEWAAGGLNVREISNKLNEEKIMPPGVYNKFKHDYKYTFSVPSKENIWSGYKVRAILKREEYLGYYIAHKKETDVFQIGKENLVPKSEWIYIPNHHPAIVTKEIYEAAQGAMKKAGVHKTHKSIEYSLKSKLKCGNCRLFLAFRPTAGDAKCHCRHKEEIGEYASCNDKIYNYRLIEENVYLSLIRNLEQFRELDEAIDKVMRKEMPNNKERLSDLEIKLSILKKKKLRQYEEYAEGLISAQVYSDNKEKLSHEIEDISSHIDELKKQINDDRNLSMEVKVRRKLADEVLDSMASTDQTTSDETTTVDSDVSYKAGTLTRETVDMFINMVYVHDTDRLEIEYTFDDIMDRAMERCNDSVQ